MTGRKERSVLVLILAVLLSCLTACAGSGRANDRVVLSGLHSGDAKFLGNRVWTSVDGTLTGMDLKGEDIRTYEGVKANWIGGIEGKGILVYSNSLKETGLVRYDEKGNITENDVIFRSDNLAIDPAISFSEGKYYLTLTEIIGNVNNADEKAENGEYILHFFESGDLKNWTLISDIARERHNIEDVDILIDGGKIYAVYEKEAVDKGRSSIVIRTSVDRGRTWGEEVTLLPADSDREPAAFKRTNEGFEAYYSSDIASPGKSYMGGKAYRAIFDKDLKLKEKDRIIKTETDKGILLYDVIEREGKIILLYAENYLTDCDLVIETLFSDNAFQY